MAMHYNYWSCSKFADWLRGTPKLKAGTADQWDEWQTQAETAHPFRFWLSDTLLGKIQDFVTWPARILNSIRYYINNRWITRSHALTAHPRDIKPGDWCDVGNRFLPCLFNELVDFVEIEQAWHHCLWSEEECKKYQVPWWRKSFLRWRTWRCPEAGLEYLRWATTLTNEEFLEEDQKHLIEPTYQAKAAKEILELYHWWTEVYPNRPEPMEVSGWSQYCDDVRKELGGSALAMLKEHNNKKLKKQSSLALKKLREIEAAYEAEDEAMMIRLIKVRNSLWT